MLSGFWAAAAETRTKRPWSLLVRARVEGAGGELEGADQEVVEELVVGEVEALDRVAAAVAADEVEEAVDAAEAFSSIAAAQSLAAASSRRSTARGSTRSSGRPRSWATAVGDLLVAVGEGEAGAGVGEALGDDGPEAAAGAGDGDDASVEVGHAEGSYPGGA